MHSKLDYPRLWCRCRICNTAEFYCILLFAAALWEPGVQHPLNLSSNQVRPAMYHLVLSMLAQKAVQGDLCFLWGFCVLQHTDVAKGTCLWTGSVMPTTFRSATGIL